MDNTNTKTNQKGLRTEQLSQYRAFAKPLDQEAEQSCQHTQHQRIIHHPKEEQKKPKKIEYKYIANITRTISK